VEPFSFKAGICRQRLWGDEDDFVEVLYKGLQLLIVLDL
jgi:hypothetical protein